MNHYGNGKNKISVNGKIVEVEKTEGNYHIGKDGRRYYGDFKNNGYLRPTEA